MKRKEIISVLNKAVRNNGFANSPMDYVIVEENDSKCTVCDYPSWVVIFRLKHSWSDNTITYDTCKVMIHNFIEIDSVGELSKNIGIAEVRRFMDLSSILCREFNALK